MALSFVLQPDSGSVYDDRRSRDARFVAGHGSTPVVVAVDPRLSRRPDRRGAVVGIVATRGDDSASNASSLGTQQLGSIQQACAQWQDGSAGSSAPPAVWCDGMVGWMTGQVRSGQMTGSMMWSNPEQMLATCQRWMVSSQWADGSTPGTPGWCGQMVDWMTQHMGDWDQWDRGWMMNGPMMGG